VSAPGRPRLAVVLCTYQGSAFVDEQLASIAAQTRLPDSMVVVDDGSTDGTLERVQRWADGVPFPVRVLRNPRPLGAAANFARAIAEADADLLALADQDDVWLPHKLAVLESALDASPRIGVAFSDAELVDAELRPLGVRLWHAVGFDAGRVEAVRSGDALRVLASGSVASGTAMAFRADLRPLVLPVPPRCDHDAWIALLASAVGEIAPVAEPLVLYRQHGGNQIGARRLGLAARLRRARRLRTDGLERRLWLVSSARERLAARGAGSDEALRLLADAEAHLRVRCGLSARRLRRVAPVAGEVISGRYGRASRGLASALRDLIA
jgi:hypothetical protein